MDKNKQESILWHDYETWGVNPAKDFPCQFAGIRTDLELNPIGKPLNWFCQIPNDYLPHPQACLVTGITPQQSLRDGMIEAEFIRKVHEQMSQPNTCTAGYNSIRFDDEVTRFALYRNFYDPYAREWQNGNSRWDLIDLVRACYALRPDGIKWVYHEDGSPSFKLEDLAKANELGHSQAHDALSDVQATIDLARLIKSAQPKLYDFFFGLRRKQAVAQLIDYNNIQPLVHVSSKLPASQGCCTWIAPICPHPTNKNTVIVLNLGLDPKPLAEMDIDAIRQKMFTPSEQLAPGEERVPLKLIHINKCPFIAPAKSLSEENAQRLGIDRNRCLENLAWVKQHRDLTTKLCQLYDTEHQSSERDPDHALYTGGFFSDADKKAMIQIREKSPQHLGAETWSFQDPRLAEMLFRYRGRNYPATLNDNEMQKWQSFRQFRLMDPSSPASIKLPEFMLLVEELFATHQNTPKKQAILKSLVEYAQNL